jgi:hypothetical protein
MNLVILRVEEEAESAQHTGGGASLDIFFNFILRFWRFDWNVGLNIWAGTDSKAIF